MTEFPEAQIGTTEVSCLWTWLCLYFLCGESSFLLWISGPSFLNSPDLLVATCNACSQPRWRMHLQQCFQNVRRYVIAITWCLFVIPYTPSEIPDTAAKRRTIRNLSDRDIAC